MALLPQCLIPVDVEHDCSGMILVEVALHPLREVPCSTGAEALHFLFSSCEGPVGDARTDIRIFRGALRQMDSEALHHRPYIDTPPVDLAVLRVTDHSTVELLPLPGIFHNEL